MIIGDRSWRFVKMGKQARIPEPEQFSAVKRNTLAMKLLLDYQEMAQKSYAYSTYSSGKTSSDVFGKQLNPNSMLRQEVQRVLHVLARRNKPNVAW